MMIPCRVYWGSHGCSLKRGHQGPCVCDCCDIAVESCGDAGCVAHPPYYGEGKTYFYGEDAEERGLPLLFNTESRRRSRRRAP